MNESQVGAGFKPALVKDSNEYSAPIPSDNGLPGKEWIYTDSGTAAPRAGASGYNTRRRQSTTGSSPVTADACRAPIANENGWASTKEQRLGYIGLLIRVDSIHEL